MALQDLINEAARKKGYISGGSSSGGAVKMANDLYRLKKTDKNAYKSLVEERQQRQAGALRRTQIEDEAAAFNERYSALLDKYNSTYAGGQQWQSEAQRDMWMEVLDNYKAEATHYENLLKPYANEYEDGALAVYGKMWNQLGEMQSGVKRAGEVYGQYGSEEEYKAGLEQEERRRAYAGMTTQELQSKINRLEGDDFRIEYDRAVQEDADAQRQLKDAQLSGAPQSIISEYQAAADAAAERVKALEEEQRTYQTDAQWLKEYAPMADYYHGVDQYGYSLAEMKPYEILDITPQSEGEQAWIEDYVENVAAQGGYIGVEDWTQAAEAQRAYDELAGPNRDAIIELADSYYSWQQLVGTEAAAPQEKRFWQKADEVSKATGLTAQELLAQVETIYPYVAQMGANELREQVAKEATLHPGLATATTYILQPMAGMQANAYLLGAELFGGTPTAANPAMTAYTYNTAIRGQVGKDISSGESGMIAGLIPTPKSEGFGIVGGDTGKWLYDAVNSTVDSAVNMLLTRGAVGTVGSGLSKAGQEWLGATVSNLVMGSGASAQRFIELKQAGYDDAQVVLGAVTSGLAEGLTEWLGGEFVLGEIKDYDDWLTAAVKSFVAEGTEEVLSAEMQSWYDWYLGQDTAGFARALFGAVAGFKAAGYSDKEAFIRAFSDTMLEYGSSYLAGGFSGLLHFAGGSAAEGISGTAETYSYAKDVKADSGEMAAVNALVEKQKVNAPKLTAGDNIVRVMKTVKAAANEANYNSTKEALRQTGLMLREEMTKNGGEVSDSLIAAINKTTVAESISKVRELSREEARLLTLTKAEQRELNSKSARAVVDSLKQVAEGSESFSDKMHRMAANYAYGFADELKKVRGEATEAAVEAVNHAYRVGKTFNGAAPTLDVILKDERYAAADRAVVKQAWEAGRDFNKEATVTEDGKIELKGASPAAVAVMNAQYSGIADEDGKAEFHSAAPAAYYTGVYYAGTKYGAAQLEEILAEHGDIKDELRAVYEQGAKEKEAAARTVGDGERIATAPAEPRNDTQVSGNDAQEGQMPQRKRGSVRNISAEEAEAAGVSTVDTSKLTKRQKTEGKILRSLAKQMGFDVVFFDSMRADGTQAGANGWYSNGTIYIDVNAGYVNDTSMLRTTAHELTHFIQQYNAEAYSKLRDFIVDRYYEADRKAFEAEVKRIIDAQKLSEGAAIDEVVADGCQMMLRDSAAPQMLYEHDAKLYDKVSAWVREWANKLTDALKKALADVAPNSATARALSQTADTMTELQKLWDEAFVGAVENKAKSPAVNSEAVQYEVRDNDNQTVGFDEHDVTTAVYGIRYEKAQRNQDLVKIGTMPKLYRDLFALSGEVFVSNAHLYQNMVSKTVAIEEGRYSSGADYHELGEEKIINAIEQFQDPIAIMESLKDYTEPRLVAVLDEKGNDGQNLIAVMELYAPVSYPSIGRRRNHVLITIYEKSSLSEYVSSSVKNRRILHIKKGTSPETAADLQLVGAVTDDVLKRNVAQFNKKVKAFKDSNNIQYSMRDPAQMAESVVKSAELQEVVEKQRQIIEELRAQMKPGEGHKVSRPEVRKVARALRLQYQSLVKVDDLTDALETAYNLISDSAEPRWTDYYAAVQNAAQLIIDNDRALGQITPEARAVLNMVRGAKISLTDAQKAEIAYGNDSYNQWRKKYMGSISIAQSGTPLDIQWQEWSASYPGIFKADLTAAEQGVALGAIVDSMKESYASDFGYDTQLAADEVAAAIMDAYFDVPEAMTYADKMQKRIDTMRRENREKLAAVREEYKTKYEAEVKRLSRENKKLSAETARLNLRLEDERKWRREWRERAATAKAEGSQRLREYRTKRNESDAVKKYRGRVESNVKALIDLMVTNTDKKHVPEALKEPIAQFIEALDLTSKQAREGGELTLKDKDYAQRLNALRAAVATYQANAATGEAEGYLDLPDGFFEMLNTNFDTPVYEMGAAELRLLDRALTILKTAISQSNRLMVNKNYARVSEAAEDTIKDLDGLGAAKDLGWLKGINKLFLWNNATPYYAFRRLGPAGETVFESLQSGWDKLALNAQKVVQDSEKIYTTQEVREWGKDVLEIELSGERKVQMTAAQAMSVYCLAKRQQGLGHLLGGGIKISAIDLGKGKQIVQYDNHTLSIEDLQAITGALTERQIQVADKLQDYMGSVGAEWGNEVSMARFGYKAFGEANYFPITSDPNNLNSLNTDAKSSDMFRLLNLSATKSLVKGANNAVVISNVFDVFAAHMADMAKYNALALPILDMVKWYNYKQRTETGKGQIVTRTLQKSLEKAFGVDQGGKSYAAEYIKQFIKDLNGVSESGRDLGFISTFMGRYKKAAVAANLRVAVQQPMSYARALAVMDAKYLTKGIAGNVGEAVREMRQYSGIAAWKNMGFFDTNIGRDLTEQIKHDETLGDRISDASMILSEKADEVTWGTLWKACKAEMADKGHSGNELLEKTAERFRRVVYATQVVDATTTRSHLMRSNSPINKMWTAFMSEPTLTYNMMLDSVLQWHYEKRRGNEKPWRTVGKQMAKAGEAYVINAVLLAMATAVLDAWRDDDDFETFWEKYTDALGGNIRDELNPVTKIVVLKDMWDILVEGGSSDRMDTAFLTQTKKAYDVVAEWFNVTFKGADPTATTYYGKMGGYGVVYEVFKAIGGLSGMPFAPASREVASLWNNTVGGLYPNLKWKTYNEKPTAGYEKLYEAMVDGDQDEQRSIIDQLHGKGYDDEKITDGVKAVIKGLYLGGDLSDEEAGDQLVAFCGYSATATGSKGVNYQLDKWSIEDFKMAADMEAAFAAGDGAAAKAAVQEQMKRYGRTESQIRDDITSYFKEDYVNGDTADRQRIRSLMLATGLYKAEDLDKQLAGWLKDAE